jgi:hypothetical protein
MTSRLARERLKEVPDDLRAMRLAARSAARQDQDQRAAALYDRLAPGAFDAEDLSLWRRARVKAGYWRENPLGVRSLSNSGKKC